MSTLAQPTGPAGGLAVPRERWSPGVRTVCAARLTALAVVVVAVELRSLRLLGPELLHPLVIVPVVVPLVLALALAIVTHLRRGFELPIHDRHVDVMVGLAAGGLGVAAPELLHARLGDLTWTLRLDLIGLAPVLLAAGTLLFGARSAARFRWALATAACIGPVSGAVAVAGTLGLVVSCGLLAVAVAIAIVRVHRRPAPRRTTFAVARVGRPWLVLLALIGGSVAAGVLGHPDLLPLRAVPGPIVVSSLPAGWSIRVDQAIAPPSATRDLTWRRTVVAGPLPAVTSTRPDQAVIDRIGSDSRLRLAGLSLGALYAIEGRRAPGARTITLTGGTKARVDVWQNPTTRLTWTFVDVTTRIQVPGTVRKRFERAVVIVTDERRFDPGVFPQPADRGAQALLDGAIALLRGTPNELTTGKRLAPKNLAFAIALADDVVKDTLR